MNVCNVILFRIGRVSKICTSIVLVQQSAVHFLSFDYTVCVLHHHHFFRFWYPTSNVYKRILQHRMLSNAKTDESTTVNKQAEWLTRETVRHSTPKKVQTPLLGFVVQTLSFTTGRRNGVRAQVKTPSTQFDDETNLRLSSRGV